MNKKVNLCDCPYLVFDDITEHKPDCLYSKYPPCKVYNCQKGNEGKNVNDKMFLCDFHNEQWEMIWHKFVNNEMDEFVYQGGDDV